MRIDDSVDDSTAARADTRNAKNDSLQHGFMTHPFECGYTGSAPHAKGCLAGV
jgi:hypothetical protein